MPLQDSMAHARRKLALQALYSFSFHKEQNQQSLRESLRANPQSHFSIALANTLGPDSDVWKLVNGIFQNTADLNKRIDELLPSRKLGKISKIELILLQLGLYEISCQNQDPANIMASLLQLADEFGSPSTRALIKKTLPAVMQASK